MKHSRRAVLAGGVIALAGCLDGDVVGGIGGTDRSTDDDLGGGTDDTTSDDAEADPGEGPPLAESSLVLGHDIDTYSDRSLSGGVGQDGIPSVDEPQFQSISDANLDDDEPVFGVVRNGVAKAYPQYVLVWHEIVNDTIGDEPVAVTYCPLTGTAQGFERGDTEFGVSGRLVNSNLIMYDRATESRWPQVLATGTRGPLKGETLREFRVVWTTFGEWRDVYPDSEVLTEDTGYARRYGSDPYGEYAPLDGYYESDGTMFSPLAEPNEGHLKSVVLGARTDQGAIAFDKETLLDERVLTGSIDGADGADGTEVVAVSDPLLSTGYVYHNPDGLAIEPDGDGYRVDGEGGFDAPDLPLDNLLSFDAMWFAWAGFYPDTTFVGEHTGPGYGR